MTLGTAKSTVSAAGARGRGRTAGTAVRAALAAVGLVGALTLTACTDDGGADDASGKGDASSAAPGASASAGAGGEGGGSSPTASAGSSGSAGELEGSWLATTDGHAVALVVTGDKAALFATGGTMCSGTAEEGSGTRTIRLKCSDGNEDRAVGTVEPVGGTSLKVKWQGAVGEETYTKAEGGTMPPGLPTAGLGGS